MSSSILPTLPRNTLARECYTVIKRAILTLELAPGAPLDEVQIAAQLGTSKTPIRETIARLTGEGLVESAQGRKKSYVAPLSVQTINEIAAVRTMLEAGSLRVITPILTDEDLLALEALVNSAQEALREGDVQEYGRLNHEFHLLLIRRTGNRHLTDIMQGLLDHAGRVSAAVIRSDQLVAGAREISRRGMKSHLAIVEGLADRDGDRAADLIKRDIEILRDAVMTPEMQLAFAKLRYYEDEGEN